MELRLSDSSHISVLWLCGFALCAIIGMYPVASVEVYTPNEVFVENGTSGVLKCTFKSTQVISSQASVTWSFIPEGSSDSTPESIFYFIGGKWFPDSPQFKTRVEWAGDLNKKDGSIRVSNMQFSDNGTYTCDVKNPPDIAGKPSLTKLRVVNKGLLTSTPLNDTGMNWSTGCTPGLLTQRQCLMERKILRTTLQNLYFHCNQMLFKLPSLESTVYSSWKRSLNLEWMFSKRTHRGDESLPQTSPAVIVGAVIGAIIGVIIIAVVAYLLLRVMRSTRDYEGCTSIESVSTQAARPGKKAESSTDGSRCSSPSAPVQGPVIYAQLDHSGSKNSFHKMEPVVYADIRKN